jgi:nucleoside-diphosphate-sugar epimerase
MNLLEEAHEHGVKTFVHLSTLDVYGFRSGKTIGTGTLPRPSNEYHRSKLEGERIVEEFGRKHPELQTRIVRAAKAIGSRETAVVIPLLKMMERGKVILPSGSSVKLSATHPKDIAQALLKAATSAGDSKPRQIKSFDVSADDLARALLKACAKSSDVKQQGVFSGKSLISQYAAEEIRAGLTLEEQESSKEIGYSPSFDLEKVVAEVSAWYQKEPWVTQDLG